MDRDEFSLSERLDALRVYWAGYVHDGVEFAPEAVAALTELLADLKTHAVEYEDALSRQHRLILAARTDALQARAGQQREARHRRIDEALAARGMAAKVIPASALLSEEHLTSGKVTLLPRAWRKGASP
jgi:deoxyribodipyrimidine photolyase